MKILICDNDPSDGNELAKNLQEQNTDFEVTVTSDWARVVDDIYTYKPDIVLMDLFWHCRNASSEDIERVGKRIENVRKEIKHIKGRYVGADKTVIDSGIRALIEIRRDRSKTDLPVLILTRFGNFLLDPGSKDIAYALGSGFLYKWDDTITQIHKIYNAVGRPTLLGKRIFIGHGHSKQWEQLRDFLRDERLPWDEFNRESPVGFETLSHLETKLSNAAFAILVMTVDEERSDKPVYARPNVIH
jgi:CheY-like chemotaxis protein